ncbi:MAG: hypothetical protein HY335_10075, partial [Deinococcus sp.]|nr:hypothetical protein [Deinococcus sp.]
LAGLGLDLGQQSNIELDLESRSLKSPRAFCAVIRCPGQVKLVINPRGGRSDYHALFHEAGHAEHYGNTSAELPYAFRKMGDASLSEAYAFLFDNLLAAEAWLHDVLGQRRQREFLRFERLYKVFMVRRYCGKLLFELELHRSGDNLEPLGEAYRGLLNSATGVENATSRFLEDLDDHFYSAQYLRAWIAEAQLRRHLEARYGETWFEDPAAGEFLAGLWRQGTSLDVVDLVRLAGSQELGIAPLLEEVLA